MKQLLDSSGDHVVIALDDRAFAFVQWNNTTTTKKNHDDNTNNNNNIQSIELLQDKTFNGNSNPPPKPDTKNDIEAVACFHDKTNETLFCAVSRFDKSLCIYSISLHEEEKNKEERSSASLTHRTIKRASSLAFSVLNKATPQVIIIAADIAGDATAFPTTISNSNNNSSRVLLGHTASMLTSIKVKSDAAGQSHILTADRDEKIRVSSFPNTCVIEGYMLGHTAFVSSMDVASDVDCTKCVSCGGDGSVRMWDYRTCQQLAVLTPLEDVDGEEEDVGDMEEEGGDMNNEDSDANKDKQEQTSDANNNNNNSDKLLFASVPMNVALSNNGERVVVVRNQCTTIDVLSSTASSLLEPMHSLECPTQPLYAIFNSDNTLLILAKESTYLLQYRLDDNNTNNSMINITHQSPLCHTVNALANDCKIQLPPAVLEDTDNDKIGQWVRKVPKKAFAPFKNHAERKFKWQQKMSRRRKKKKESQFMSG